MTLRVGFRMQPTTIYSRITRLVTGAPIHAALFLSDGSIFQSDAPQGIQYFAAPAAPADPENWRFIEIPDADESKLTALIANEAGCGYDYFAIVFGWTFGMQRDGHWFCSELAAYALTLCGVILKRENPAKYTPRRLYTELLARYGLHE